MGNHCAMGAVQKTAILLEMFPVWNMCAQGEGWTTLLWVSY